MINSLYFTWMEIFYLKFVMSMYISWFVDTESISCPEKKEFFYCKNLNCFLISVIVMLVFAELISGPEIIISNESEICES